MKLRQFPIIRVQRVNEENDVTEDGHRGREISLAFDDKRHQQLPLLKRTQYQQSPTQR